MIYNEIIDNLNSLKNQEKSKILQRFFKTGKNEYGEGDIFLGIAVPQVRTIAKKYYREINFNDLRKLLHSKIHEERSLSLFILIEKFQNAKKDINLQKEIITFYLDKENLKYVNNWDLVDISCYKLLGEFLVNNQLDKDINILYNFANSNNLWVKRIAIISTFAFIKKNIFDNTLEIAIILLNDNHDLIQKAVGWMLREVGKRDKLILIDFLNQYSSKMKRVTIRYAIEKFNIEERKYYLLKNKQ